MTNSAERNSRDERLEAIDESRGMCALGFNRAGIDRVDADSALAEFLREGPSQPVHGRLSRVVNRRPNGRRGADNRAEVDNAATLRSEVVERFLRGKDKAQNIEIEQAVKVLLGDLAEGRGFVDASVTPVLLQRQYKIGGIGVICGFLR